MFDVFVNDDFADAVGVDAAAAGIFHGSDVTLHGGVDAAVFKGQVGVGFKGAVLQDEVLAVAQGLGAAYVAANQLEVLGIPPQEFPLDAGVVHGDVLALPEGVLGVQVRVADHHVP